MRRRTLSWPLCGLLALLTTVIAGQEKIAPPKEKAPGANAAAKAEEPQRAADREAIRRQSGDFVQAFAKGDAKAVAASWTEQGEYYDDTGTALRGRAEIEQEFAQFFKEHPTSQVAVEIDSI